VRIRLCVYVCMCVLVLKTDLCETENDGVRVFVFVCACCYVSMHLIDKSLDGKLMRLSFPTGQHESAG